MDYLFIDCSCGIIIYDGSLFFEERDIKNKKLLCSTIINYLNNNNLKKELRIVVGPGSFSGIRSLVSLVLGIAMGRKISFYGVSFLEAYSDLLEQGTMLFLFSDFRYPYVIYKQGESFVKTIFTKNFVKNDCEIPDFIKKIMILVHPNSRFKNNLNEENIINLMGKKNLKIEYIDYDINKFLNIKKKPNVLEPLFIDIMDI